jgi:hypothetical protein
LSDLSASDLTLDKLTKTTSKSRSLLAWRKWSWRPKLSAAPCSTGIAPFITAQLVGMVAAVVLGRWLWQE